MSYLRNGWSVNLRAIENCIFSIRSIERNMDEAHFTDVWQGWGHLIRLVFSSQEKGRNNFAPLGADPGRLMVIFFIGSQDQF